MELKFPDNYFTIVMVTPLGTLDASRPLTSSTPAPSLCFVP